MLPPVQSDEALLAHGIYQQLRQGQPTDIQEHWMIHCLPDSALIWRSQLVYGTTPLSACYLLRDPDYRPMQMVFYWRWPDGHDALVEYRFMPGYATILLYGQEPQEMILPATYEVYGWHTITENFIWIGYDPATRGTQSFTVISPGIQDGTLWPHATTLDATLERAEIMPGPHGPYKASVFAIEQPEVGLQRLHIDRFGVPTHWELEAENLAARLAEYTRVA